jgi:N-acetylneuraminic acid mutarotase
MLAVAAVVDETLFLCSGVSLSADGEGRAERKYLQDAFAYHVDRGWERIADLPRATVAAPSPAPSLAASQFSILGGDSGNHVQFRPPEKHPGFSQEVLTYRTDVRSWGLSSSTPHPVVTTGVISWREQFVIPSGEVRPGKRTPRVWSMSHPAKGR